MPSDQVLKPCETRSCWMEVSLHRGPLAGADRQISLKT